MQTCLLRGALRSSTSAHLCVRSFHHIYVDDRPRALFTKHVTSLTNSPPLLCSSLLVHKRGLQTSKDAPNKSIVSSVTQATKNGLAFVGDKSLEFVKNPTVLAAWCRSGWGSVKDVVKHTWLGFKLLAADIRIASTLLKRVVQGLRLTRREYNLLVRVGSDVFRLVPFSLFIIIPMMEFALPLALKLFPNMLPSTFEGELKRQDDMKKTLKVRLEMAKYLQETVAERAERLTKDGKKVEGITGQDLDKFIASVRQGIAPSNKDLRSFLPLFRDEFTLDHLRRPQLVAMCKYMQISHYFGDSVLRFRLRHAIKRIRADDREILWEGLDSLSLSELQAACRARGMRSDGVSEGQLRQWLGDWLALSSDKKIPSSLLILSRAFMITSVVPEDMHGEEAVKAALSSLPAEAVEEVSDDLEHEDRQAAIALVAASERKRHIEKMEESLEDLKREEEEMRQDHEEEAARIAKDKKEKEDKEKERQAAASVETGEVAAIDEGDNEEEHREMVSHIVQAVKQLSAESAVEAETQQLASLQKELEFFKSVVEKAETDQVVRKVEAMIQDLTQEIARVDSKLTNKMRRLDSDNDGVVSKEELALAAQFMQQKPNTTALLQALEALDTDADGRVTRSDLIRVLRATEEERDEEDAEDDLREEAELEDEQRDESRRLAASESGGAQESSSSSSNKEHAG